MLKQVHPDTGISNKAMAILNSFVNDIFERIATEASSEFLHADLVGRGVHVMLQSSRRTRRSRRSLRVRSRPLSGLSSQESWPSTPSRRAPSPSPVRALLFKLNGVELTVPCRVLFVSEVKLSPSPYLESSIGSHLCVESSQAYYVVVLVYMYSYICSSWRIISLCDN